MLVVVILFLVFSPKGLRQGAGGIPLAFACLWLIVVVCRLGAGITEYPKESEANQFGWYVVSCQRVIIACRHFAEDSERGEWPETLRELSPQYLSEAQVNDALSGYGGFPAFEYARPARGTSNNVIVLISKRATNDGKYVVGYADGAVNEESRPFK
jgi:hypothetical protein